MGHRFKFNSIDVRMLTCAGVEISMDPPELLDKKFNGLQRREKKYISLRIFSEEFQTPDFE